MRATLATLLFLAFGGYALANMILVPPPAAPGFTNFLVWTDYGAHVNTASRLAWTDYGAHVE
jgi:hypothetical protein